MVIPFAISCFYATAHIVMNTPHKYTNIPIYII